VRRRDFIKVVAGLAAAWPLAARAQQPALPVIGSLATHRLTCTWTVCARSENKRLPFLPVGLAHRQVAVIVAAGGTPSAVVAKAETASIPVVFEVAGPGRGWACRQPEPTRR
jgi:putative tryptophan/tyrosine transport system substrate-binding protein